MSWNLRERAWIFALIVLTAFLSCSGYRRWPIPGLLHWLLSIPHAKRNHQNFLSQQRSVLKSNTGEIPVKDQGFGTIKLKSAEAWVCLSVLYLFILLHHNICQQRPYEECNHFSSGLHTAVCKAGCNLTSFLVFLSSIEIFFRVVLKLENAIEPFSPLKEILCIFLCRTK